MKLQLGNDWSECIGWVNRKEMIGVNALVIGKMLIHREHYFSLENKYTKSILSDIASLW